MGLGPALRAGGERRGHADGGAKRQRAGAERQRGEEGETEAGGGEAQGREHGHETAYTPESCVSLRRASGRTGRIGWAAMHNERWRYWGPLGIVLGVAFGLRLWGIKQGLPYVYDVDEYGHFVPEAVRMFGHGLNPHYFVNPPALTYLLHVVFGVWFGVLEIELPCLDRAAVRAAPRALLPAGAGGGCAARDGLGVAALPARRAPVRSRRRPARERRDGGRLLTGFLRPSRAQRRAHPGGADALAARHGGHPAPGTDDRLPARRDRPGPCGGDEVHGGRDAPAAARRGRGAVSRRGARAAAGRGDRHGPRAAGGAGGVPDRKPLFAARLPRLPRGTGTAVALHRTVERLLDRRPAAGQLRLLPVVVHVGARVDPRAGGARRGGDDLAQRPAGRLGARAGRRALSAVPRPAGALLRPLAVADLPRRLPARGELRTGSGELGARAASRRLRGGDAGLRRAWP